MPAPPFTAYLHPSDPLEYCSYAIPDGPVQGEVTGPLARLRSLFRERGRRTRFEFLERTAPRLASLLEEAGFLLELRAPLLTCSAAAVTAVPVEGLEIVPVTAGSPPALARAFLTVRDRAFGARTEQPSEQAARAWLRGRARAGAELLGFLDGEPVAVASATPPEHGLSELAGVGVLEHARARGIGGAITAAAARAAAVAGAELVFLSPGSDGARSVYERVGFRPQATMLHYFDPERAASIPAREGG